MSQLAVPSPSVTEQEQRRAGAETSFAEIDKPIVDAIRKDDLKEAVTLATRAHGAAIGRFAFALLGSQSEAEEIVQETFIASFTALRSYRSEGSVRSFLFTIARRQSSRALARRPQNQPLDAASDVAVAPSDGLRSDEARRMRAALAKLKPSEREAVLLRYESDLSFREVATSCGCEETAARQRVSRGLKNLRDLLEKS